MITAAGTHVYAWQPNGKPVRGLPGVREPGVLRRRRSRTTTATRSAASSRRPAIAHLEGFAKKPDIVEPSLDGHLYAWRANGKPVPGYPIALVDPAEAAAGHAMIAESINEPAIGDLDGSGHDDVVVASNEVYGAGATGEDVSFAGRHLGGGGLERAPVRDRRRDRQIPARLAGGDAGHHPGHAAADRPRPGRRDREDRRRRR